MIPKQIDVIVLGLSPTGLYAVREAARAGYKVLGVGAPRAPGAWSRYLAESVVAQTAKARVDAIITRFPAGAETKPVLIVTSDQDLEVVMAQADTLSTRVHLQKSYQDGLAAQILDKDMFYQICDANDVLFPKLWATSVEDAKSYRDQISYPCMVKPARIQDVKHLMGGTKGWVLKSPLDFDKVLPRIPVEAGTLLMQEIVPGPESNITLWCGFIDQTGTVRQRLTARKLRQYPSGFGSASLVQSEVCEKTAEAAERLLTKLGYCGIAAAEFKTHPDTNELQIIEVNPRPSLWFALSSAAGVPLVETAIAEATGAKLPPMREQRNGVRWRYVLKDMASKLFYARAKNFVLPAPNVKRAGPVRARSDVVGAWTDPMPVFGDMLGLTRKVVERTAEKLGFKK
ncbi:MAG: ATP-grasp domain-containing protein [Pacificibacter sp.]|uniref:carboxylate--amine ligase n=1 Tax=Pacificibacter sp. TaxID=1917866 RepID=UPI0032199BE8